MFENISNLQNLMNDPKFLNSLDPKANYYASKKYEFIIEQIHNFEKSLDDEHEIALKLTYLGTSTLMLVTHIGYRNPDLIYFYGYINNEKSQLIQHISQLNFIIVSVKKKDPTKPPKRIGKIGFSPSND